MNAGDSNPVGSAASPDSAVPHKRRVRYSGRNPRRFEDKYKEHAPEKYQDTVAKVIASGKTPVGTHRPILVAEILEALNLKTGNQVADCTLGYGGHAQEILKRIVPGGRLLGFDVDPIEQPKTVARLREAGFGEDVFTPIRRNFAGLAAGIAGAGLPQVDAVLADLGVSSMQIDDPVRGFSFKTDGPLDLRLNPSHGRSAAEWLAEVSADELARVLQDNGDEPAARAIASDLLEMRDQASFTRTRQLALGLHEIFKKRRLTRDKEEGDARVRRIFQALRIAVNDEFGVLDALLRQLPACLKAGGRVAILTFHSGEDRRVKKAFAEGERGGIYSAISYGVVRPGSEELRANSRSASAKLRWAVRAS